MRRGREFPILIYSLIQSWAVMKGGREFPPCSSTGLMQPRKREITSTRSFICCSSRDGNKPSRPCASRASSYTGPASPWMVGADTNKRDTRERPFELQHLSLQFIWSCEMIDVYERDEGYIDKDDRSDIGVNNTNYRWTDIEMDTYKWYRYKYILD